MASNPYGLPDAYAPQRTRSHEAPQDKYRRPPPPSPRQAPDDPIGAVIGAGVAPPQGVTAPPGERIGRVTDEQQMESYATSAIRGLQPRADYLAALEQAGIEEMKGLVREGLPGIMASPLDDREISDMYAGMLEDIARSRAQDMQAVADYSGAAGIRGAAAADLIAQVELGALGHVTRGMRDLRKIQTEVEAAHKITQLNAIIGGGQMLATSPSLIGIDAAMNAAEYYAGMWGVERSAEAQERSAEEQRRAAVTSSIIGAIGSIFGGVLA